ncbi:alpha/beta-hydrolase [Ramaria rubella]|nr:alpha/beta-hydrolase [Ramaria rubella]
MATDPAVYCPSLSTTFVGARHPLASHDCLIHQFRGIKYASIPGRFRWSQLHTTYTQKITDAKGQGPIALQLKSPLEGTLFGFTYESPVPRQDEFDCLNLTITRPGRISQKTSLPVMVWIHGGSNVTGHGNSFLADAGKFVKTSMEEKRPVIVVAINYRLGLFGFAASEALLEANRLLGEEGVGNYGKIALYDQLNAIAWIRKNIQFFGGDPAEITLFGESAGAVNIHSLLLSRINHSQPIATRAIIQSGVVRVPAVQTVEMQGSLLSRIMSKLGVSTIEELRHVPSDVLLSHTPSIMNATDDGVFFRTDWNKNPIPEGIKSLIIGDCMFESALYLAQVSLWTTTGIIRRVRAVIPGVYKADAFLRSYGITPSTDDEDAQEAALNILNDAHFAWPTDKVARSARANQIQVFRYAFDQGSAWNPVPHHAVDLVYLFNNPPSRLPSRKAMVRGGYESESDSDDGDYFWSSDFEYNAERVRRAIQDRWIAFAYGERPWSQDKLYVFGPEGEIGERDLERELSSRRRMVEWREAFAALTPEMVHKVAVELGNGPRMPALSAPKARF